MTTPSQSTELPPQYVPADVESAVAQSWRDADAFHADPDAPGKPYSIVIPPPNVTAALHLGHALNNTLQDVLIRHHRMLGDKAMWMPGTDHAGIATQTVVEKRVLQEEGKRRTDFQRDEFVQKIQAWKDEYEKRITDQLVEMGCSCDWARQRFTMDEVCAKAVREAFFQLFSDGLIYRGKRLVNWDPVTQTALADDEVEMENIDGNFWYLRYPLTEPAEVNGKTVSYVTVATTRPETMLGDTAVAVNPSDPERAPLIGKHVKLPIVGRVIPIVGDEYVVKPDPESSDEKAKYASGYLKVTPAHDPNDWEIGQRHEAAISAVAPAVVINVMAPDASISRDHGWAEVEENIHEAAGFIGMDRYEARQAIVTWFRENEMLEEVRPYRHTVGHSYRSHVPVEPYLSDQWYVKVTDDKLAGAALRAMAEGQRSQSEGCTWTEQHPFDFGPAASQTGGTGVSPVIAAKQRGCVDGTQRSVDNKLHAYRRHLPHWEMGGSTYFVTFRIKTGQLSEAERQLVLDACLHWHGDRADIHRAVVMPDHVHLLLTPRKQAEGKWHALADLLHSIKSFTAHEISKGRGTSGPVWQDESFDRIVRDEEEFREKWDYMEMNPVKAELAAQLGEYAFIASGAAGTAGDGSALRADDGRDARPTGGAEQTTGLTFYPERYAKTFQTWHENIRDWCISRQLWWGHRIPVWSRELILDASIAPEPVAGHELDAQILAALHDAVGGDWDETVRGGGNYHLIIDRIDSTIARASVCVRDAEAAIVKTLESAGFTQDPDVLDTWFSSALWPMSTMGWPNPQDFPGAIPEGAKLLETFNPTSVLCTAREIITLWVSRMVMFNLYFKKQLPFRDVFIHAMIQDGHGQKMSKSLGNGVDPMDIIHSHGADAMRFTLTQMTTNTQDVRMPVDMVDPHTGESFTPKYITTKAGHKVAAPEQEYKGKDCVSSYGVASGEAQPTDAKPAARNTSEKFDIGQRFANKLWNALRFSLTNLEGAAAASSPSPADLGVADRWILSRLKRTVDAANACLGDYRFADYAQTLYDFFWRDLCDWYIEAVKPTIRESPAQQQVMASCLDATLRLLHPAMPFITERLWKALNETVPARGVAGLELPASELLVKAPWPVAEAGLADAEAEATFEQLRGMITAIREVRTTHKVPPRQVAPLSAKGPQATAELVLANKGLIETLARVTVEGFGPDVERPDDAAATVLGELELYLHGLVDADAEKARLAKQAEDLAKSIKTLEGRLSNKKYVDKAPAHLVQQTRDQLEAAQREAEAVQKQLAAL